MYLVKSVSVHSVSQWTWTQSQTGRAHSDQLTEHTITNWPRCLVIDYVLGLSVAMPSVQSVVAMRIACLLKNSVCLRVIEISWHSVIYALSVSDISVCDFFLCLLSQWELLNILESFSWDFFVNILILCRYVWVEKCGQ